MGQWCARCHWNKPCFLDAAIQTISSDLPIPDDPIVCKKCGRKFYFQRKGKNEIFIVLTGLVAWMLASRLPIWNLLKTIEKRWLIYFFYCIPYSYFLYKLYLRISILFLCKWGDYSYDVELICQKDDLKSLK